MRHSYTNLLRREGTSVTKRYAGPGSIDRQRREELALQWVGQWLPVPEVLASEPGMTTTRYVEGRHGQELIDAGLAGAVLHTCGALLASIQALPELPGLEPAPGSVLVHGDFGPNNVLLTPDASRVVLVGDWEWCAMGSSLTDLAWCEFIVREHHPDRIADLAELFAGYGSWPVWELRQAAMVERALHLVDFVRSWERDDAVAGWEDRVRRMQSWDEIPGRPRIP